MVLLVCPNKLFSLKCLVYPGNNRRRQCFPSCCLHLAWRVSSPSKFTAEASTVEQDRIPYRSTHCAVISTCKAAQVKNPKYEKVKR